MTSDELQILRDLYCLTKCPTKGCCTAHLPDEPLPVRCPRQCDDGSCSVYRERYEQMGHEPLVIVGHYRSLRFKNLDGTRAARPFYCGKIEDIVRNGGLPPQVARSCCYARPELLEELKRDADENRA